MRQWHVQTVATQLLLRFFRRSRHGWLRGDRPRVLHDAGDRVRALVQRLAEGLDHLIAHGHRHLAVQDHAQVGRVFARDRSRIGAGAGGGIDRRVSGDPERLRHRLGEQAVDQIAQSGPVQQFLALDDLAGGRIDRQGGEQERIGRDDRRRLQACHRRLSCRRGLRRAGGILRRRLAAGDDRRHQGGQEGKHQGNPAAASARSG